MHERWRGVGVVLLGLAVGLALGCGAAVAQAGSGMGDPDGAAPAIAMGAGRMVRGTVTAVSGDKVTLKTDNGDSFQVAITPNTRLMKERNPIKPAEIHVGDGIGAMGEIDQPTKTVHALFVSVVDAEQVKKLKESFGKTWITGKVIAIDDLKLTILRSDKVTQVIEVDEDTSFKKGGRAMQMAMQPEGAAMGGGNWQRPGGQGGGGAARPDGARPGEGESITLADVKVGDNIAGQGSLKNGVFVPKTLAVGDPAQRRRRPGTDGAPSGSPNGAAGPQ